jgi:hypothetical protein
VSLPLEVPRGGEFLLKAEGRKLRAKSWELIFSKLFALCLPKFSVKV